MSADRLLQIGAALTIAVALGIGVWLLSGTPGSLVNDEPPALGPTPGAEGQFVTVLVEEGDSASAIGERLEEAGVIQSADLFRVLTALIGVGDRLAAGEYEFSLGEPTVTVVRRISSGLTAFLVVTIREGLRAEEVADLLEQQGVTTSADFRGALGDVYEASFLAELPPGSGLEGFLFPATYDFSRNTTGHEAAQRLLSAFGQRYGERIQALLPTPSGLTLKEAVTLASIVEREAQVAEERPVIASVFLNRLAIGMPLQADPTVQYALGNDPASVAEHGYWKRGLTSADLAVASPYNTYVNAGLPPGPIANPGLASILAVLRPAETEFLFFVAQADGSHVFAETLGEHNRNVCRVDPARPECR